MTDIADPYSASYPPSLWETEASDPSPEPEPDEEPEPEVPDE